MLGEAQNEMLEAIKAGVETDLRNREGGMRQEQRGMLQTHRAQILVGAGRRELFEQAAEMKNTHMAVAGNCRQG